MARTPNSSPQTRTLIEALLTRPDAWHYGYELSKQAGLKPGTLYPTLMRLEAQGWLETCWAEPEAGGRPPRHLYRLTPAGARASNDIVRRNADDRRAPARALAGAQ